MNVKKEVIERIAEKLKKEQHALKMQCESNKWKMQKLSDEQTVNKRQIAKLGEMIKGLNS